MCISPLSSSVDQLPTSRAFVQQQHHHALSLCKWSSTAEMVQSRFRCVTDVHVKKLSPFQQNHRFLGQLPYVQPAAPPIPCPFISYYSSTISTVMLCSRVTIIQYFRVEQRYYRFPVSIQQRHRSRQVVQPSPRAVLPFQQLSSNSAFVQHCATDESVSSSLQF